MFEEDDSDRQVRYVNAYDLAAEEKRLSAELKKIPTLRAADEAA